MVRGDQEPRTSLDRVEADGVMRRVRHTLSEGVELDLLVKRVSAPKGMLIFLPSAQARSTRTNPIFHRWSWAEKYPDWHVVVMSDPGLNLHDDILGSWFLHPSLDLVAETSAVLSDLGRDWGVGAHQTILCGSSMGGFLALMCASHLAGAMAVAEIPQFDLREYGIKSTLRDLELHALNGRPLEDHFTTHAQQLSVLERFRFVGHVPALTIVTNIEDVSFSQAQDLIRGVTIDAALSRRHSAMRLEIVPEHAGHVALRHEQVRASLRAAMTHVSETNARVLEAAGESAHSFDEMHTDDLSSYFSPGFSSAPGVTLHVVADIAQVQSSVSDGHRYIWGRMTEWSPGQGPYVHQFFAEGEKSVLLVVAYYDAKGSQIDCAFYSPGEERQHVVPDAATHTAVGLRLKGRFTCRVRIRGSGRAAIGG